MNKIFCYDKMPTILSILNDNNDFLKKVFLNLILQLIITTITIYLVKGDDISGIAFFVLFIISIIVMFLILLNVPIIYKIILFAIFSICFGIMMSPVYKVNKEVLMAAVFGTLTIFILFFIFGLIITSYGYDISWMAGILLLSLFVLIITGIISLCVGISSVAHTIYLYIGLLIFCLYILLDTNRILLNKKYRQDFVSASMGYYLDILNIFMKLLQIFTKK